jgi:NAD(P)-dependent dehydrogenase (short-subunit alcohol dehydrogenase family)
VVAGLGGSSVALGLSVDMTDAASVDAAVAAHVAHFGSLDVMVANAGIAVTAPLLETTAEQWQQTMDVNLKGVLHCYQSAARQMISQGGGGRLIAAASVAGRLLGVEVRRSRHESVARTGARRTPDQGITEVLAMHELLAATRSTTKGAGRKHPPAQRTPLLLGLPPRTHVPHPVSASQSATSTG